jgi:hypothetical protein
MRVATSTRMKHRSKVIFAGRRSIPFFPFIPLVPLAAILASVTAFTIVFKRLHRLEHALGT